MNIKLLHVPHDTKGIFRERVNRFLSKVELRGSDLLVDVHVRDPGRLEEILFPGNEVLLEKAKSNDRKTNWTLLAGKVNSNLVFVNSGYHRRIAEKLLDDAEINLFGEIVDYEAEKRLGESRIDFLLDKEDERKWVEVKGCTLAEDGRALFPDAPTKRGKRHVEELIKAMEENRASSALMFLVFRPDSKCFAPHEDKDSDFTKTFELAVRKGVDVEAVKLDYDGTDIRFVEEIPVCEAYRS
ncbi:MAG: DNA/RNA nuclease SfsA [Candidatus Thermoplasmatota archaeon]|nr:DNA/RNA nuclease SfsA [Candidatus Thermoplasmatota archaeon]